MTDGKYLGGIRTLQDLRDRCRINDETGCWCWALSIYQGAPRVHLTINGERSTQRGRRAAKMLERQSKLSSKQYCYPLPTCSADCVNPEHVFVGNLAASRASIAKRGLLKNKPSKLASARRAGAARAKLTAEQVSEVRNSVESNRALAARFGVSNYAIWSIRVGKSWRTGAANSSVFNWRPAA